MVCSKMRDVDCCAHKRSLRLAKPVRSPGPRFCVQCILYIKYTHCITNSILSLDYDNIGDKDWFYHPFYLYSYFIFCFYILYYFSFYRSRTMVWRVWRFLLPADHGIGGFICHSPIAWSPRFYIVIIHL